MSNTTIMTATTTMACNTYTCLVTLIVFLSIAVGCISACKCVDPPTTCTGNFAIRGRITNSSGNQTRHDDITYTVDVLEVIRHPSRNQQPIANISSVTITTGSHSCGYPDLVTGTIYFIAGDYEAPAYELAKCGGIVVGYDAQGELDLPITGDSSTCSACLTTIASSVVFVLSVAISLAFK